MNNKNQKQQQKNKILIGLIIVVLVQIVPVLLEMMDMSEGTAAVIAVLFVMAFVWLIFYVIFKKLRSMGKFSPSAARNGQAPHGQKKAKVEFSDGFAGLVERMAKRDEEEAHRYQQSVNRDCEYGDENHSFSHDNEQRLAQLDDFLKNGIIDRTEYQVLKKRYSQNSN